MVNKRCRGSTVIEMAYLMPVVLLTWMLILFTLFYYHDKNILAGAAYETAVVGSELLREEKKVPEERLEQYMKERIRGKTLFYDGASVEVVIEESEVILRAYARKKGFEVSIEKKAAVTEPEKRIRKMKILKQKIESGKERDIGE